MLVQGESGLLSVNGTPKELARVGISVYDIAAGDSAYAAILQALFARHRTGQGRAIEVSLFHTMADWMNVPYLQTAYSGRAPAPVGLSHPSIAPYGAFDCLDGLVLLSVQSDREWASFATRILGQADLAHDPRFAQNSDRVANRAVIEALIRPRLAHLTREAAIAVLTEAGIAWGRLASVQDLTSHPQARRITVDSPAGPVTMMARGTRVAGTDVTPGPALNQHGPALRHEFG